MTTSLCEAPTESRRDAWRRECAAEEAGWEAQLRKMAGPAMSSGRPMRLRGIIRAIPSPAASRVARIMRDWKGHDSLLLPRSLPIFTGSDAEDLVCGKCADVIARRASPPAARCRYPEGDRLIVRCTCGALNVLGQTTANRDGSASRRGKAARRG